MIRTRSVIFVAAAVLASVGAGDTGKPNNEAIEGIWISTEIIEAGKKTERQVRLEFKRGKVTMTIMGLDASSATYTLNPKKSPPTMDITVEVTGTKKTMHAVYELKGDKLKICHPFMEGGPRPTAVHATSKTVLATFKRQKP